MKHKKAQVEALADFYAYIAFILIILVFFFLFKFGAGDPKPFVIEDEKTNADVNTILSNYLRTPVVVNGKEMTIADIVSMVDLEDKQEERLNAFRDTAKKVFEQQFPPQPPEWKGANPWWIRVYDMGDTPTQHGKSKYTGGFLGISGPGYSYGWPNCDPEDGDYLTTTILVPKANKGYTQVVFCIMRFYLKQTK